jgi:hypothetical protein
MGRWLEAVRQDEKNTKTPPGALTKLTKLSETGFCQFCQFVK